MWEGSILCKKDLLLQYRYPAIKKGEDSVVIETLYSNDLLCIIDNEPHIYVYNYHGDNTWEVEHFERIFVFSRELPFDYAEEVQEIMDIN